jgi:hypothetical protein
MVDFLKRSVEQLTPPTCTACDVTMIWYRSMRPAAQAKPEIIVHYFQCPNCNSIGEVTSKVKANGNGNGPERPASARPRLLPPQATPLGRAATLR